MEGPGVIMNATEYLESQNPDRTSSNTGTLGKRNPFSMTDASWVESLPHDYENRRHSHRLGRNPNSHIGSPRYATDPSKLSGQDSSLSTDEAYTPSELLMAQGKNPRSVRMDLPVDEDDYLMPSPQNNQNPPTYLDVVGDSKGSGESRSFFF